VPACIRSRAYTRQLGSLLLAMLLLLLLLLLLFKQLHLPCT
jgi:hypothetical protein